MHFGWKYGIHRHCGQRNPTSDPCMRSAVNTLPMQDVNAISLKLDGLSESDLAEGLLMSLITAVYHM